MTFGLDVLCSFLLVFSDGRKIQILDLSYQKFDGYLMSKYDNYPVGSDKAIYNPYFFENSGSYLSSPIIVYPILSGFRQEFRDLSPDFGEDIYEQAVERINEQIVSPNSEFDMDSFLEDIFGIFSEELGSDVESLKKIVEKMVANKKSQLVSDASSQRGACASPPLVSERSIENPDCNISMPEWCFTYGVDELVNNYISEAEDYRDTTIRDIVNNIKKSVEGFDLSESSFDELRKYLASKIKGNRDRELTRSTIWGILSYFPDFPNRDSIIEDAVREYRAASDNSEDQEKLVLEVTIDLFLNLEEHKGLKDAVLKLINMAVEDNSLACKCKNLWTELVQKRAMIDEIIRLVGQKKIQETVCHINSIYASSVDYRVYILNYLINKLNRAGVSAEDVGKIKNFWKKTGE